jgi:hypothetical protein
MANALETQGFKFEIADPTTSPLAYVEVGEVTSFTGFDGAAAEIDVTHLQSVAKEWLMGLQDFGTFNLEVNYLPTDAGQDDMRAAKASRDIQAFRVTFSDNSTATFQGYVLSAPVSGGVDAKVDGSFAVRITGNVTFS